MDLVDLKKANELQELINITSTELSKLDDFISVRVQEISNNDIYNLHLAEYKDGSGFFMNLNRQKGNLELLEIMQSTLEKQLEAFQLEFKNI